MIVLKNPDSSPLYIVLTENHLIRIYKNGNFSYYELPYSRSKLFVSSLVSEGYIHSILPDELKARLI